MTELESPRKKATIWEVAKLAGVSQQTVSRYIKGNGGLRPTTVVKIDSAIAELNWRPNVVAQSMRTKRSNRIAVVLPELTNFIPMPMLKGASAAAHSAGYLIDVVGLEGNEELRGERVLSLLNAQQAAGILSFTPLGEMVRTETAGSQVPIVVIGEYDDKMRSQGVFADGGASADIVEYLAELGHRRFLHVAGADDWASARNRRDVYVQTIEKLGLESHDVVQGDWSVKSGYDAAFTLPRDSGVTAVLAANDYVAMGVIRGFLDAGWRVPEDVSVFGWDDEPFTNYFSPTISSVSVDREGQGRQVMEMLLAQMRGDSPPGFTMQKLTRLAPRMSSGPAPV